MLKTAVKTEDGSNTVYELASLRDEVTWRFELYRQMMLRVEGIGARTWSVAVYEPGAASPHISISGLASGTAWLQLGQHGGSDSTGGVHPSIIPSRIVVTLSGTGSGGKIRLTGQQVF